MQSFEGSRFKPNRLFSTYSLKTFVLLEVKTFAARINLNLRDTNCKGIILVSEYLFHPRPYKTKIFFFFVNCLFGVH